MSTLRGGPQLHARLAAIKEQRALLLNLQLDTVNEAKDRVPRKTGNLGRSIVPGIVKQSSALVIAGAGYAAYVELGTKPHRIPKSGNAKRPMPIGGGRRLSGRVRSNPGSFRGFAWHVNHPGTKPQPYLLPGAKAAVGKNGLVGRIIDAWNGAA